MKNGAVEKAPAASPTLTELETVKLENFALRHTSLQQQLQANLTERAAYIKSIEAARPGYQWDEKTGLIPATGPSPAIESRE